MKTGDIILLPFPFAELTNIKVRPAVVICTTADKHRDVLVSAITSIVPEHLNKNEILLEPDPTNGLRVRSVIKVDRIVTLSIPKCLYVYLTNRSTPLLSFSMIIFISGCPE